MSKVGKSDSEKIALEQFLSDLGAVEILYLSLESHIASGRILADLERTGQPIGFADTAIAAIALQNNLTLITGNLNHYQRRSEVGLSSQIRNLANVAHWERSTGD